MNQPVPSMPQNLGPEKPAQVRPWLLIVLLIVILAGAAYFGYYWQKSGNTSALPAPNQTENTPSEKTANFKTYTDSTNGFSFQYPSNWNWQINNGLIELRENNQTYNIEGTDSYAIVFSVSPNSDNQTAMEIANDRKQKITVGTAEITEIVLDGQPAVKVNDYLQSMVIVIKNDKIYLIVKPNFSSETDKNVLTVYNQIIASFHFAK